MMTLIMASSVDGGVSIADIQRALLLPPQAQENGAAVTGVDASRGVSASEVGEGQSDRGAASGFAQALEDGQVLAETAASPPQSNPELAAALEKIQGQGLRHSIITLYHETDVSLEHIARVCTTDLKTIETFLANARKASDSRVLRGDDARKLEFEN
jgi:hypothetical protein